LAGKDLPVDVMEEEEDCRVGVEDRFVRVEGQFESLPVDVMEDCRVGVEG
jgi:hypothetical protein